MGYNQNPTNDELTKTFRDFCDLFNRLQLNFFIQCGTLLGYTRENDFIAWDYDIDIGMFYKDFKGKEKMIIDELERNYWFLWIQHGQYDSNFNIQFIHPTTRVRVDLDIVYPIEGDKYYYYTGIYKWGRTITGLETTLFKDKSIKVFTNKEEWLEEEYGDWKTPKIQTYSDWVKENKHKCL
tara:strand:- start:227 stop:769 length:543 start_codon:yes stop_codon:yes gene_type:complete